ncbi:hypothetical protein HK102_004827 [Quaeritorhiza haematococci]|nr:hypothetical protein HK102_004827 [Quaeritorhiza haematococci]
MQSKHVEPNDMAAGDRDILCAEHRIDDITNEKTTKDRWNSIEPGYPVSELVSFFNGIIAGDGYNRAAAVEYQINDITNGKATKEKQKTTEPGSPVSQLVSYFNGIIEDIRESERANFPRDWEEKRDSVVTGRTSAATAEHMKARDNSSSSVQALKDSKNLAANPLQTPQSPTSSNLNITDIEPTPPSSAHIGFVGQSENLSVSTSSLVESDSQVNNNRNRNHSRVKSAFIGALNALQRLFTPLEQRSTKSPTPSDSTISKDSQSTSLTERKHGKTLSISTSSFVGTASQTSSSSNTNLSRTFSVSSGSWNLAGSPQRIVNPFTPLPLSERYLSCDTSHISIDDTDSASASSEEESLQSGRSLGSKTLVPESASRCSNPLRADEMELQATAVFQGAPRDFKVKDGKLSCYEHGKSKSYGRLFPVQTQHIAGTSQNGRNVILHVAPPRRHGKSATKIRKLELTFPETQTANKWALDLNFLASKGNTDGVQSRKAIFLVDAQDEKSTMKIVQKYVNKVLDIAKKPVDIKVVEFSEASVNVILNSIDLSTANAFLCLSTRKPPKVVEECLKAAALRCCGMSASGFILSYYMTLKQAFIVDAGHPDMVSVIGRPQPVDAVDLALTVLKGELRRFFTESMRTEFSS